MHYNIKNEKPAINLIAGFSYKASL